MDKCVKERGGGSHIGALHEFNDSEPRCAVDGYEARVYAAKPKPPKLRFVK